MQTPRRMDAIKLLDQQHRDVDALFEKLLVADDEREIRRLFFEIADQLVIHTTIEERHFYPTVRAKQTEEIVKESFQEHGEVKQMIAELMEVDTCDDEFVSRCEDLQEAVQHHVKEERTELFPKVRKLLSADVLEALGQEMTATMAELMEDGEPRERVLHEPSSAPPIE